jgi:hypothetical protein
MSNYPTPSLQPIVAATAAAPHTGPHCARRTHGTKENHGPRLRGRAPSRHVAVAIRRSVASKAPMRPPNCFSTYPAVNANYRSPQICRACAPYAKTTFAGMYASFLNKLKPRLPLLCQMHCLCSLVRVIYSEFGLIFDSNITTRYAACVAELESRGHPPSRALSHAPFCHLHPHHSHKDNTPLSHFSLLGTRCPLSPRFTAPAERRLSLIYHCAPHTTPYLIRCYSQAALLLRFQRRRRGLDKTRHACQSTKQNSACAPPCGAIPAQATSTPSFGAWGSIPHHHTVLVGRVTSTVTSDL